MGLDGGVGVAGAGHATWGASSSSSSEVLQEMLKEGTLAWRLFLPSVPSQSGIRLFLSPAAWDWRLSTAKPIQR